MSSRVVSFTQIESICLLSGLGIASVAKHQNLNWDPFLSSSEYIWRHLMYLLSGFRIALSSVSTVISNWIHLNPMNQFAPIWLHCNRILSFSKTSTSHILGGVSMKTAVYNLCAFNFFMNNVNKKVLPQSEKCRKAQWGCKSHKTLGLSRLKVWLNIWWNVWKLLNEYWVRTFVSFSKNFLQIVLLIVG